jgi:hypothetical protein
MFDEIIYPAVQESIATIEAKVFVIKECTATLIACYNESAALECGLKLIEGIEIDIRHTLGNCISQSLSLTICKHSRIKSFLLEKKSIHPKNGRPRR